MAAIGTAGRGAGTAGTLAVFALFLSSAACSGQSFSGGPGSGDGGTADGCQGSACVADAAGPCMCTGTAPSTPNYMCADGTTGGPYCNTHPDGTCDWENRSCTPACPNLGCDPACPNGVLRDANGCETCTCAPVADSGDGSACTTNADCSGGQVCGFLKTDACRATGTCLVPEPEGCNAAAPGCACDGTVINIVCNGFPSAYAPAPLLHTGLCADAGASDGGGDGGACCPSGWDLHSCTYPDGGAAMACHNPQLGCASSLTCGQGCDGVVTGRCGP
jgi:hypothetical protein